MKMTTRVAYCNMRHYKSKNILIGIAIILTTLLLFVIPSIGKDMVEVIPTLPPVTEEDAKDKEPKEIKHLLKERAAKAYEDSIPQEVKQARLDELMDIQQGISAELSAEKIGKQMKVIIDRLEGDYYIGRTEFDSPEVDPEVLIDRSERELKIGQFYHVEVVNADDFDLYAKIINDYE